MPDTEPPAAPAAPLPAVRTLAVIGAGSMGHGIAQTAALAGITTILHDVDQAAVDRGLTGIDAGLARMVARGRLGADERDATLARLHGATDLQAVADVDAVIEAAPEQLALKKRIFTDLDALCERAVFLASNTSSLSLQEIAAATARPGRVLGLHYFNPAQVLPLVEVVIPLTVDPGVAEAAEAYCRATGKTPIRVQDTPAFVVNRLFVPFALDAIRLPGVRRGHRGGHRPRLPARCVAQAGAPRDLRPLRPRRPAARRRRHARRDRRPALERTHPAAPSRVGGAPRPQDRPRHLRLLLSRLP